MDDDIRQSLLLSECSDCLLDVPLQSQGCLHIPYNPQTRRYSLVESRSSALKLFCSVDELELDRTIRELEEPQYYAEPSVCLNLGISLALLVCFLTVKATVLLLWVFFLMDPLVLFGGLWVLKKAIIVLCVFRLDQLSRLRNSPLRHHLRLLNQLWIQRGLRWSLDPHGHFLTLGPPSST